MGSICSIFKPQKWRILKQGISKQNTNEVICLVKIGEFDDYIASGDICEWISKTNLEKIISGEYIIQSFPYAEKPIKLFDKNKDSQMLEQYEAYKNMAD